jgi:hypothetical protein
LRPRITRSLPISENAANQIANRPTLLRRRTLNRVQQLRLDPDSHLLRHRVASHVWQAMSSQGKVGATHGCGEYDLK